MSQKNDPETASVPDVSIVPEGGAGKDQGRPCFKFKQPESHPWVQTQIEFH